MSALDDARAAVARSEKERAAYEQGCGPGALLAEMRELRAAVLCLIEHAENQEPFMEALVESS